MWQLPLYCPYEVSFAPIQGVIYYLSKQAVTKAAACLSMTALNNVGYFKRNFVYLLFV